MATKKASTKRIASLTPEQAAELPRFRARWFDIGTCTEPADRPRAEAAIAAMYSLIGKPAPRFLWFQSPAASMCAIKILGDERLRESLRSQLRSQLGSQLGSQLVSQLVSQLGSQLWSQLESQLESQLWSQLGSQLVSQLGSQLRSQLGSQLGSQLVSQLVSQLESQLWSQLGSQLVSQLGSQLGSQLESQPIHVPTSLWGQMDAAWIAFYLFCRYIGAKYADADSRTLDLWGELAQSCGWWWPYENWCILSERPQAIQWDADRTRLHCETGPAILFRDGYAVYSWRGTRVPGKWLDERATVPVAEVLAEANADVRTAGLQIVGWPRVLAELGAAVVNEDADAGIGTLYRVDLPGEPDQRILKARCGTGRDVALRVPPAMKTALEANAWTWGLEAKDYMPEVRT